MPKLNRYGLQDIVPTAKSRQPTDCATLHVVYPQGEATTFPDAPAVQLNIVIQRRGQVATFAVNPSKTAAVWLPHLVYAQMRGIGSSVAKSAQHRVIFSGIQPTGVPHLGNYVGALRQWVQLQHQEPASTKLIYSIVDLHAITTPQRPEKLRKCKREALAALLAIGIDPERATIFYQSSVSELALAA